MGSEVVYLLVPHTQFSLELPAQKQASSSKMETANAFQWERITDLYVRCHAGTKKKKSVYGDKIKMFWQSLLGKCGLMCLGDHICGHASQRQSDSEMWFLGCTGNGYWRLFLSSLQFWWLQFGLGNKGSAEISLHFPQAQLLALDILKLALQWARSLWEQCMKCKTRSIYLWSLVTKLIFPYGQLWSGVNEDEAEAELGPI